MLLNASSRSLKLKAPTLKITKENAAFCLFVCLLFLLIICLLALLNIFVCSAALLNSCNLQMAVEKNSCISFSDVLISHMSLI